MPTKALYLFMFGTCLIRVWFMFGSNDSRLKHV